jgi:hypothetical protein
MKSINEISKPRVEGFGKLYYNLSELTSKTGLSIRALKYRMLSVKERFKGSPQLLSKQNRQWKIHYSLLPEFDPKYNLKTKTEYNYQWNSTVTWNPKDSYDIQYHIILVDELKRCLPNSKLFYAIEIDKRGVNHTHLLSEVSPEELNNAVESIFTKMLYRQQDWQVKVEPVFDRYALVEYLKKAPLSTGLK